MIPTQFPLLPLSIHILFTTFHLLLLPSLSHYTGLETLSKLALDAKLECVSEDSAESCEEGELSDRDDGHPGRGVNSKSGKDLISPAFLRGPSGGDEGMNAWNDYDDSLVGESKSNKSTDIVLQEQYAYHQWRGQIFEPTNFTGQFFL